MVSLWPWKKSKDDSASFEKTLATLSAKIQKANITKDSLYARSRRYRVLWTLYTSLAYLLSALILLLVTGWQNWGPIEYTILAAGPVVKTNRIYLVRAALVSFYDYRVSSAQAHVDDLQQQREAAIDKFKAATNYNSTHQLLEKYGAVTPNSSPPQKSQSRKSKSANSNPKPAVQQRTGIPPPPTANIPRPGNNPSPQQSQPQLPAQPPSPASPQADFAPNAFPPGTLQTQQQADPAAASISHTPQWYDRILDLLLGEDETKPFNRLALICQHCKLVNGLAPPGIKTLQDLGRWKCAACGGWNGEESEVKKMVRLAEQATSSDQHPHPAALDGNFEPDPEHDTLVDKTTGTRLQSVEADEDELLTPLDDDDDEDDEEDQHSELENEEPPARSTRSKAPNLASTKDLNDPSP